MNKEQIIITANYINKYGNNHFDISKWFQLDSNYLINNERIKITDYTKVPLSKEEIPYYDLCNLNDNFEYLVEKTKTYKELTHNNYVDDYLDIELETIYEQICALPFEVLKESDISNCNTTACIAGWAVLAYNDMVINNSFNETIVNGFAEAASDILDLDENQALNLFYCNKNSVWDLVASRFSLKEKAWKIAEEEFSKTGASFWQTYEEAREKEYYHALGSLLTSKIVYEVLMDIANEVIDIRGGYAEYYPNYGKMDINGVYSEYMPKSLIPEVHTQS